MIRDDFKQPSKKPALSKITLVEVRCGEEVQMQARLNLAHTSSTAEFKKVVIDTTLQNLTHLVIDDIVKDVVNLRPPKVSMLS